MGYEIIDRLCSVTEELATIVKEQAAIIEQSDIPIEVKEELKNKRAKTDLQMEIAGRKVRRLQGEHHG